jgi:hypothetical protein
MSAAREANGPTDRLAGDRHGERGKENERHQTFDCRWGSMAFDGEAGCA